MELLYGQGCGEQTTHYYYNGEYKHTTIIIILVKTCTTSNKYSADGGDVCLSTYGGWGLC